MILLISSIKKNNIQVDLFSKLKETHRLRKQTKGKRRVGRGIS